MPDVHAVVLAAGLNSGRDRAALEFYRASPGGQLIVACEDGRVTGVSYAVSFGQTGWIGNVGVDPGARGRGLGTAVSQAAIDALRRAGVTTMLLTATDLGRPIYEKLGFGYDGTHYGVWRRDSQPGPDGDGVRSGAPDLGEDASQDPGAVRPGRIDDVVRLDAGATGEDRRAYLSTLAGHIRVAGDGAGYRMPLPWGGGPVIASSASSARALLTDVVRTDAEPFLAFPEQNVAAAELAASLGLRQARRIPRMRLGPPVPGFRPERVFSVFSFAVG
jgi:GNAT superfamily N-acetyltransferase